MYAPLVQYGPACGSISGSIRQLEILLPEDCASVPEPLGASVHGDDPVLKSGKSSIIIPFEIFSASLASRPESGGRGGDAWLHGIECRIRQNRESLGAWMMALKNRRIHLISMDWHGIRMFHPMMRCQSERGVEAQLSGGNAFRFAFSRRSTHPGIYLDPGVSLAVLTGEGTVGGDGGSAGNVYEVLRLSGNGIPIGTPGTNEPRVAVNDAGKMWAWDGTMPGWVTVGKTPNEWFQKVNAASGTTVNLSVPAPFQNSNLYISVYRDGSLLSYGDDFTHSSSTLTFVEPLVGERLLIITKTIS